MAKKFLPFLMEGAEIVEVYKAVQKRFSEHPPLILAGLTYIVVNRGISDVQDFLSTNKFTSDNEVISSLTNQYSPYSIVKSADLETFLSMHEFLVGTDTINWEHSLEIMVHESALTVIYIKSLLNDIDDEKYQGFGDITSLKSVEYCMENLTQYVKFSDLGVATSFRDVDHIRSYILYQAFIRVSPAELAIWPFFEKSQVTDTTPEEYNGVPF